ncbi:YbaB/EbfC family nucleoid-associated protein [Dactylosporangium sp. NPDC000244]|uniref:YbaB/EbfC family nucleoid-associated protein n=1 Tax=Dactylosporangium sp. NPDC000244 TaxID=3154365 RepID=UPI003317AC27
MLDQAFALRDQLATAASTMEESEVTEASGCVRLTMTLTGRLTAVHIDARAAEDVAAIERHLLLAHAAVGDTIRRRAEDMLGPLRAFVAQASVPPQ